MSSIDIQDIYIKNVVQIVQSAIVTISDSIGSKYSCDALSSSIYRSVRESCSEYTALRIISYCMPLDTYLLHHYSAITGARFGSGGFKDIPDSKWRLMDYELQRTIRLERLNLFLEHLKSIGLK